MPQLSESPSARLGANSPPLRAPLPQPLLLLAAEQEVKAALASCQTAQAGLLPSSTWCRTSIARAIGALKGNSSLTTFTGARLLGSSRAPPGRLGGSPATRPQARKPRQVRASPARRERSRERLVLPGRPWPLLRRASPGGREAQASGRGAWGACEAQITPESAFETRHPVREQEPVDEPDSPNCHPLLPRSLPQIPPHPTTTAPEARETAPTTPALSESSAPTTTT